MLDASIFSIARRRPGREEGGDELTSRETSDPPSTPTPSNEPTIGRKVAGDSATWVRFLPTTETVSP